MDAVDGCMRSDEIDREKRIHVGCWNRACQSLVRSGTNTHLVMAERMENREASD